MLTAGRVFLVLDAFLLGLIVGSFLNVCIYRWPREESVVRPRSRCPHCGAWLKWYDLVPLLSYFRLHGRCRYCSAPISPRYPLVELLNGLIYGYLAWQFGLQPVTFKTGLFASMMLVLVFTDLSEFILPDEITLGGLAAGIVLSPFLHLEPTVSRLLWFFLDLQPQPWAMSLAESALAAALLGGLLFFTGEFYFRIRKLEGLGLGDVKMIAMIGAFWGIADGFAILLLSAVVGAVSGLLIVLIGRKEWTYALPFGSYLGVAAILVTIWGEDLWDWYLGAIS